MLKQVQHDIEQTGRMIHGNAVLDKRLDLHYSKGELTRFLHKVLTDTQQSGKIDL